ncbi:MAG: ZIP family metal transporter [Candidatus Nanoarchaeia archaeon]|nr:ZIP family metal transporter [Candidatus Nanoarchaeia archaeon]
MNSLILILLSTFIVSLISLIGVITLGLKHNVLEKILLILVALSAGALMGGAFLHLIPEAIATGTKNVFLFVLIGFVLFFLIEKILHWRHCHKENCNIHTFAHMSWVGDSIHNFIDGLIIAGSFMVNTPLGITTTIAVIFHEIPQEIGDFGVLIYAGVKKSKALLLNFVSALAAVLGGLIGYFLPSNLSLFLIPFAAGGFIYISASDLVPELRKELSFRKSLLVFGFFILGIVFIYLFGLVE